MTEVRASWVTRSAPFSFFPKGALTHHLVGAPCARLRKRIRLMRLRFLRLCFGAPPLPQSQGLCGAPAVVLPRCVRSALCEADCALFGERQTMPPCLRAAVAIVCAEGAVHLSLSLRKPAPGSFIAEAGLPKSLVCFLFCERETEKGNTEVIATGNIPLGGEGHQQRHGSIRLRSIGLYELFRHL